MQFALVLSLAVANKKCWPKSASWRIIDLLIADNQVPAHAETTFVRCHSARIQAASPSLWRNKLTLFILWGDKVIAVQAWWMGSCGTPDLSGQNELWRAELGKGMFRELWWHSCAVLTSVSAVLASVCQHHLLKLVWTYVLVACYFIFLKCASSSSVFSEGGVSMSYRLGRVFKMKQRLVKICVPWLAQSGELRTGGCCSGGFSQAPWPVGMARCACVLRVLSMSTWAATLCPFSFPACIKSHWRLVSFSDDFRSKNSLSQTMNKQEEVRTFFCEEDSISWWALSCGCCSSGSRRAERTLWNICLAGQNRSILPWLKRFDKMRRVFHAVHLAGRWCCVQGSLQAQVGFAQRCLQGFAAGIVFWWHSPALPWVGVGGRAGGAQRGWQCPGVSHRDTRAGWCAGAAASPAAALKPHQRNRWSLDSLGYIISFGFNVRAPWAPSSAISQSGS